MASEIEIIIAFLFKRSGKEKLTPSELYLPLSIDLKWFSPKQARELVNTAVQQKLLIKKGSLVKPGFDYENIVVPIGFYPSGKTISEKEEDIEEHLDVIQIITKRIIEKTGQDERSIAEKITMVEQEKNISKEVAALLISREYDIDVDDCFEEIEKTIFRESRG
jgi:hypothetical protein